MLPTGLSYRATFLTQSEQEDLLLELSRFEYRHDTYRGVVMKRSSAEFGYLYVATGRRIEPTAEIPSFLRILADRCEAHCPCGTRFNKASVTCYPKGAGIGWHVDAPFFGDAIAGVSLGAIASMEFVSVDDPACLVKMLVEPGSLYVMSGAARWRWKHRIVPVRAERFSITFRSVVTD